jgi:Fe-Mn family superoxide dismutase
MAFVLKDLPYAHAALAPHISEETMTLHHDKHLLAYVNNTNNLIAGNEFEDKDLIHIIKNSSGPLFNNAAQIYNHELFWECMSASGGGSPQGALADALNQNFGSFDEFKAQFTQKATTQFGSGWAWLAKTPEGKLVVSSTANGDNPLTVGNTPILGLDVWEHAYYVDYRNLRPKYVEAFWEIVNWDFVASQL